MDDVISRQAAKHALCRAVHKNEDIPCENQTASCLWSKTRVCDYAREIDALPSAQQKSQWIPCSERLPEHGGRYLISVLDGINRRTTVAPYMPRCKAWTMTGRMAYWKVIAWMPLPEPYKGVTE